MSTDRFPELYLTGDAKSRGLAHGEQFRERIAQTIEYYRGLFCLPESELREKAATYRQVIFNFNPDYATEIEAIAEGAGQAAELIYALNSRSELLNNCTVPECTSAINAPQAMLGQNWDWSQALESLVILLRIKREDGHSLATLTEPGILAKVGMNNRGLGVCLNILRADSRLKGLPVHILLRAILDCDNMAQVRGLIADNAPGKASHILAGDEQGDYCSAEFAGETHHRLSTQDGVLCHSNHYLAAPPPSGEPFYSTHERYDCATRLLGQSNSAPGMWQMLSDQSQGLHSICRPYSPSNVAGYGNVGTVFSVLMNLKLRSMKIRPGCNPGQSDYTVTL
jgi:isopenicillin-N N-acyltransferase like protein